MDRIQIGVPCREEKHVKIRIELGPKEAAAGQCVLAKCKKPGAVAAKTTVRVSLGDWEPMQGMIGSQFGSL